MPSHCSMQHSLTVLVPRVWPFLRHTISSVRRAALETLFTLLSRSEQVKIKEKHMTFVSSIVHTQVTSANKNYFSTKVNRVALFPSCKDGALSTVLILYLFVCFAELCSVDQPHPARYAPSHLSVLHSREQRGNPRTNPKGLLYHCNNLKKKILCVCV